MAERERPSPRRLAVPASPHTANYESTFDVEVNALDDDFSLEEEIEVQAQMPLDDEGLDRYPVRTVPAVLYAEGPNTNVHDARAVPGPEPVAPSLLSIDDGNAAGSLAHRLEIAARLDRAHEHAHAAGSPEHRRTVARIQHQRLPRDHGHAAGSRAHQREMRRMRIDFHRRRGRSESPHSSDETTSSDSGSATISTTDSSVSETTASSDSADDPLIDVSKLPQAQSDTQEAVTTSFQIRAHTDEFGLGLLSSQPGAVANDGLVHVGAQPGSICLAWPGAGPLYTHSIPRSAFPGSILSALPAIVGAVDQRPETADALVSVSGTIKSLRTAPDAVAVDGGVLLGELASALAEVYFDAGSSLATDVVALCVDCTTGVIWTPSANAAAIYAAKRLLCSVAATGPTAKRVVCNGILDACATSEARHGDVGEDHLERVAMLHALEALAAIITAPGSAAVAEQSDSLTTKAETLTATNGISVETIQRQLSGSSESAAANLNCLRAASMLLWGQDDGGRSSLVDHDALDLLADCVQLTLASEAPSGSAGGGGAGGHASDHQVDILRAKLVSKAKGVFESSLGSSSVSAASPVFGTTRWFVRSSLCVENAEIAVSLPIGWKLVGGGGYVSWEDPGAWLSESYPVGDSMWYAAAGCEKKSNARATVSAFICGLYDPDDWLDVRVFRKEDTEREVECGLRGKRGVDLGYLLVGGGVQKLSNESSGCMLMCSAPRVRRGEKVNREARSKLKAGDPVAGDKVWCCTLEGASKIRVYAIGIKMRAAASDAGIGIRVRYAAHERSVNGELGRIESFSTQSVHAGYALIGGGGFSGSPHSPSTGCFPAPRDEVSHASAAACRASTLTTQATPFASSGPKGADRYLDTQIEVAVDSFAFACAPVSSRRGRNQSSSTTAFSIGLRLDFSAQGSIPDSLRGGLEDLELQIGEVDATVFDGSLWGKTRPPMRKKMKCKRYRPESVVKEAYVDSAAAKSMAIETFQPTSRADETRGVGSKLLLLLTKHVVSTALATAMDTACAQQLGVTDTVSDVDSALLEAVGAADKSMAGNSLQADLKCLAHVVADACSRRCALLYGFAVRRAVEAITTGGMSVDTVVDLLSGHRSDVLEMIAKFGVSVAPTVSRLRIGQNTVLPWIAESASRGLAAFLADEHTLDSVTHQTVHTRRCVSFILASQSDGAARDDRPHYTRSDFYFDAAATRGQLEAESADVVNVSHFRGRDVKTAIAFGSSGYAAVVSTVGFPVNAASRSGNYEWSFRLSGPSRVNVGVGLTQLPCTLYHKDQSLMRNGSAVLFTSKGRIYVAGDGGSTRMPAIESGDIVTLRYNAVLDALVVLRNDKVVGRVRDVSSQLNGQVHPFVCGCDGVVWEHLGSQCSAGAPLLDTAGRQSVADFEANEAPEAAANRILVSSWQQALRSEASARLQRIAAAPINEVPSVAASAGALVALRERALRVAKLELFESRKLYVDSVDDELQGAFLELSEPIAAGFAECIAQMLGNILDASCAVGDVLERLLGAGMQQGRQDLESGSPFQRLKAIERVCGLINSLKCHSAVATFYIRRMARRLLSGRYLDDWVEQRVLDMLQENSDVSGSIRSMKTVLQDFTSSRSQDDAFTAWLLRQEHSISRRGGIDVSKFAASLRCTVASPGAWPFVPNVQINLSIIPGLAVALEEYSRFYTKVCAKESRKLLWLPQHSSATVLASLPEFSGLIRLSGIQACVLCLFNASIGRLSLQQIARALVPVDASADGQASSMRAIKQALVALTAPRQSILTPVVDTVAPSESWNPETLFQVSSSFSASKPSVTIHNVREGGDDSAAGRAALYAWRKSVVDAKVMRTVKGAGRIPMHRVIDGVREGLADRFEVNRDDVLKRIETLVSTGSLGQGILAHANDADLAVWDTFGTSEHSESKDAVHESDTKEADGSYLQAIGGVGDGIHVTTAWAAPDDDLRTAVTAVADPSVSMPPMPSATLQLQRQYSHELQARDDALQPAVDDGVAGSNIEEQLQLLCRQLATLLCIDSADAERLLVAHGWRRDKALASWLADESVARMHAGIVGAARVAHTGECCICMEDEADGFLSVGCDHLCCFDCWRQHIDTCLNVGGVAVSCPASNEGCPAVGAALHLDSMGCAAGTVELLWQRRAAAYVNASENVGHCKNPKGCDGVLQCPAGSTSKVGVCNMCGQQFCPLCPLAAHSPATCDMMGMWKQRGGYVDEDSKDSRATEIMLQTTKPCPKCGVRIEKNQGCQHMNCTQCHYDWCWVCLGPYHTTSGCSRPEGAVVAGSGSHSEFNKYNRACSEHAAEARKLHSLIQAIESGGAESTTQVETAQKSAMATCQKVRQCLSAVAILLFYSPPSAIRQRIEFLAQDISTHTKQVEECLAELGPRSNSRARNQLNMQARVLAQLLDKLEFSATQAVLNIGRLNEIHSHEAALEAEAAEIFEKAMAEARKAVVHAETQWIEADRLAIAADAAEQARQEAEEAARMTTRLASIQQSVSLPTVVSRGMKGRRGAYSFSSTRGATVGYVACPDSIKQPAYVEITVTFSARVASSTAPPFEMALLNGVGDEYLRKLETKTVSSLVGMRRATKTARVCSWTGPSLALNRTQLKETTLSRGWRGLVKKSGETVHTLGFLWDNNSVTPMVGRKAASAEPCLFSGESARFAFLIRDGGSVRSVRLMAEAVGGVADDSKHEEEKQEQQTSTPIRLPQVSPGATRHPTRRSTALPRGGRASSGRVREPPTRSGSSVDRTSRRPTGTSRHTSGSRTPAASSRRSVPQTAATGAARPVPRRRTRIRDSAAPASSGTRTTVRVAPVRRARARSRPATPENTTVTIQVAPPSRSRAPVVVPELPLSATPRLVRQGSAQSTRSTRSTRSARSRRSARRSSTAGTPRWR